MTSLVLYGRSSVAAPLSAAELLRPKRGGATEDRPYSTGKRVLDVLRAIGLQGKALTVCDEGVRVPLIVYDPRDTDNLTAATDRVRNQLVSSVDVLPMLVSIAHPDDVRGWMTGDYAQLYGNRTCFQS